PYRRRKVGSRAHPVPDLVQITCQVFLELLDRLFILTGRATIGFDRFVRFVHQALIDVERFLFPIPRVHPVAIFFLDSTSSPHSATPTSVPLSPLLVCPT